ncbi:MAG: L,D-transpeptidase [Lachnospiraceae bacterium]|nr:L,D-transpeptidase [Lachnospiraceae bacterium]
MKNFIQQLSKRSLLAAGSAAALLLLLLVVYLVGIGHYKTRLLPGTVVNGNVLGGKTAEEAREALQDSADSYVLVVKGRNNAEAEFHGDALSLTFQDQGELEQLIREQNAGKWIFRIGKQDNNELVLAYTYDEEALNNQLAAVSFLQPENMDQPVNAYVGDNGQTYTVVSEYEGTWLETEPVKSAVVSSMLAEEPELDLDAAGLYTEPELRSTDEGLNNHAAYLNSLLEQTIVYDFVDRQYVVDREVIRGWIVPDENNNCTLSSELAAQWVYNMAYDTDTFANSHVFTTHNGEQIQLASGGDYGWAMDQEETTAALLQALNEGYSGNLDPSYIYGAQDRSSNDIGGTYVEICITEQKLYLYEDYQLKLETSVITGNHSTGFDTPSGSVWAIDGKKYQMQFSVYADVVVDYWMPFNDECGMHDAYWRSAAEYADPSYYLTEGSHGCVNTPYDAMEVVFGTMEIGYPVVVYYSAEQPVGPQPTEAVAVG